MIAYGGRAVAEAKDNRPGLGGDGEGAPDHLTTFARGGS
jgi:hypothetical protein